MNFKHFLTMLLLPLLLYDMAAQAQNRAVTGTVVDELDAAGLAQIVTPQDVQGVFNISAVRGFSWKKDMKAFPNRHSMFRVT